MSWAVIETWGGSGGRPGRAAQLPAAAVNALADLVAAGFGIAQALAALPRQSLKPQAVRQLDIELTALRAGGPLDVALDHLGLDITAASIHGSQARGADVEAALRADAAAKGVTTDALRNVRRRVQFFALALAGLTLSTFYLAFVSVPALLKKSTENLPPGFELPPALVEFEGFRNLWLAAGGAFLLLGVALVLTFRGILGRQGWSAFVQDLRLRLPFLRAHAIHTSTARLLEALAFEQAAGLPANETLRRTRLREPVPRLAAAIDLAAARLEAGDPWGSCFAGTLLDTPLLGDLTELAGFGARPTKGLQWAAAESRERAVKGLRRAVAGLAALAIIPSFAFLLVLMQVASVTAAIAQVESIRMELESLTSEVDQILQNNPQE
jgi:type II secretory pathway component PulF